MRPQLFTLRGHMRESSHYKKWLHKHLLLKKIENVVFIEDS